MILSMAPKPKVSPDKVINEYFEVKRKREAAGVPMRGINTEVADLLGITPQRVGQVIKAYEAELVHQVGPFPKPKAKKPSKGQTKVSILSEPMGEESPPSSVREAKENWKDAVREAKENWKDAVSHREPELETDQKEPSGGGGSWLSRLNGEAVIKQLQRENNKLELRIKQLEETVGALRVSRLRNEDPVAAPIRERILEVLADGDKRTYNEIQEAMDYHGNIRPAMINLVKTGKVVKEKTRSRRKNEPHYRFRISQDLLNLI